MGKERTRNLWEQKHGASMKERFVDRYALLHLLMRRQDKRGRMSLQTGPKVKLWERFDEEGAATLEVVIVTAILLAIAILFHDKITTFAKAIFEKVFNDSSILSKISWG